MASCQPSAWSFCAMAQAMLRLLARPKITAVFFVSVIFQAAPNCFAVLILNAVEGAFDFFHGVAEDDGTTVRAAHRAISFGECGEEPLHFDLVERHIHFDRGVARGARS